MVATVSKTEMKARALELFREVQATHQPLIITERGKPVLQLRSWSEDERSPLEILRGSVLSYERPTDPVGDDEWEMLA